MVALTAVPQQRASLASPHSPDPRFPALHSQHLSHSTPLSLPNKSIPPSKLHSTLSFCTFINQLHLSKMHHGDWVTTILSLQNCSSWERALFPPVGLPGCHRISEQSMMSYCSPEWRQSPREQPNPRLRGPGDIELSPTSTVVEKVLIIAS